ncbi:hypothetical protein GN241_08710 [Rhodobacteraceae bacterium IMCC1335]
MITDITKAYKNYAIYIPSLQESTADYCFNEKQTKDEVNKRHLHPLKFDLEKLNFLNKDAVWHHNATLYSCGQYKGSTISHRNIVAERDRSYTTIVGDSGGYQLGTNQLKRKQTKEFLNKYTDKPTLLAKRWKQCGEVERVVGFLNAYCDYSMTLDMVMWGSKQFDAQSKSPVRNLSVQQLIDLTVENLKYIDSQRDVGNEHKTKWLNVTQCIGKVDGVNSGLHWYNAVKDFDFEGWAFGGGTAFHLHQLLRWTRKIIEDGKFENREWIHILMKSPPYTSILYTAIQNKINELCNTDIRISYDSSSASQIVGKQYSLFNYEELTSDISTWSNSSTKIDARLNTDILSHSTIEPLPSWHPLSTLINHNDFFYDDGELHKSLWFDTASYELARNYNMYVQHRRAIDACDLYFDSELQNHSRIPSLLIQLIEYCNEYLTCENPNSFERKHVSLLREYDSKFASIKKFVPKTEEGWNALFEDFEL